MSDFVHEEFFDGYESMHENDHIKSRRFHHNDRSLSPLPSFELRPMPLTKKPLYPSTNTIFRPVGSTTSSSSIPHHKCTCKHKTRNNYTDHHNNNNNNRIASLSYAKPITQITKTSTTHQINEPITLVKSSSSGCCGGSNQNIHHQHHHHKGGSSSSGTSTPVKIRVRVPSSSPSIVVKTPDQHIHRSDSIYYTEPTQAKIVYANPQTIIPSATPTLKIIKSVPTTTTTTTTTVTSPHPHQSRILTIRPPPSPPCSRKMGTKDTVCQQTTTTTTTTKRTTTRSRSAGRGLSRMPSYKYMSKSYGDLTNISDISQDSLNLNDLIIPSKSKVNVVIDNCKHNHSHNHNNNNNHQHRHHPNCKNNRISKSYLNLSTLDDSIDTSFNNNEDCLKIVEKKIVTSVDKPRVLPRTISIQQINTDDEANTERVGGVVKKITYVYDDVNNNNTSCSDNEIKKSHVTYVKENKTYDSESDISLAHCVIKSNPPLMPCNRSLHTGAIFNGYSFGLLTQHIQIKDSFYTSFSYKTCQPNGVVMMIIDEHTGNSFFIELVDSQLRATLYIDGEPDSCWTNMGSLTNDIWTNVKVQLIGSRLSLTVRHNFYTKNHRCKLRMPIHGDLFVAGYPSYLKPPPICRSKSSFFVGEMKDFYVNYNGIKWYGVPTISNQRLRTWF